MKRFVLFLIVFLVAALTASGASYQPSPVAVASETQRAVSSVEETPSAEPSIIETEAVVEAPSETASEPASAEPEAECELSPEEEMLLGDLAASGCYAGALELALLEANDRLEENGLEPVEMPSAEDYFGEE